MKRIKRLLYLLVFLLIPSVVNASKYEVKNYNIDIEVSKDREYTYEEKIELSFSQYNSIIYKELPKEAKDFKVNADYTTENGNIIKVNCRNNLENTYNYKYSYQEDEYSSDIYEVEIANTFDNELNNITFNLTLTEDFNRHNIEFYLNDKKIEDIKYEIKEKTISGEIKNLKEDDILTIKVDYGKIYLNTTTLIGIIVPVVLAFLSFLIWYIYGRDLKYPPAKTPNIPRNLSPLDVSLIYNGAATEKDVYCLLLHLANKGYIKIIEDQNNEFTIKKGKEYDGKNYIEASFIKALFKKSSTLSIVNYLNNSLPDSSKTKNQYDKEIKSDELNYRFQRAARNVLPLINDSEEKKKYYEPKAERKKYYLLFMVAVILILVTSLPFIEINKLYYLPLSVVFSIFSLYILISFINSINDKNKYQKILLLTILLIVMIVILLIPSFQRNRIYALAFLIGFMCVSFILLLFKYMPKRSIYGAKQFSKIAGVKEFLLYLNKKELNNVLEINPNYLYDILPYSYILGTEELVLKKIKEYGTKEPSWYTLNSDFTVHKFNNSLERLYENTKNQNEE